MREILHWTLGENKPNFSEDGGHMTENSRVLLTLYGANQRYPVLFSFRVYYLWLYLYIYFQTQDVVNFIKQNYEE
jgi:hypothetical protein